MPYKAYLLVGYVDLEDGSGADAVVLSDHDTWEAADAARDQYYRDEHESEQQVLREGVAIGSWDGQQMHGRWARDLEVVNTADFYSH